jgi:hypothetical protein
LNCLRKPARAVELDRKPPLLDRHPHPPRAVSRAKVERDLEDYRVDVHVDVAVNVRKFQTRRTEPVELCGDFEPQLATGAPGKKVSQPGERRVIREVTSLVNQGRNLRARKRRAPHRGDEVYPDGERGVLTGEPDCSFKGRAGHHQACARQNAFEVRAYNRLVDFLGRPEIIGVDYQLNAAGRRL